MKLRTLNRTRIPRYKLIMSMNVIVTPGEFLSMDEIFRKSCDGRNLPHAYTFETIRSWQRNTAKGHQLAIREVQDGEFSDVASTLQDALTSEDSADEYKGIPQMNALSRPVSTGKGSSTKRRHAGSAEEEDMNGAALSNHEPNEKETWYER